MRTLYLECNMGAAGDMLAAALLELHPDRDDVLKRLNALGLPGVRIEAEPAVSCGIRGTRLKVTVHGEEEHSEDVHDHVHGHEHDHEHDHGHVHEHGRAHRHSGPAEIRALLAGLRLPREVLSSACAVYDSIARAEARAHGTDAEHIHFHEVGSLDAVADVVTVCLLLHELAPERVIVSPVRTGWGMVRCAHGILPVPTPATASLLEGVPTSAGPFEGELCTPTGAALLVHFADSFERPAGLCVQSVGYGMGTKVFEAANCVRAMLGETEGGANERICSLECNVDDMTGEAMGYATERLMALGARDVFVQPIQMKKNRPGMLLKCLCMPEDADRLAEAMLRYTTTIGVRRSELSRYALAREERVEETPLGPVRVKVSHGYGVERVKPEFEDIRRIAEREGTAPETIRERIGL